MLVRIPQVLTAEEVAYARQRLEATAWEDGRTTAGAQSAPFAVGMAIRQTEIAQGQGVVGGCSSWVGRRLAARAPMRRS